MKYTVELKSKSSQAWVDAVKADFSSFLQDHADCERKASGLAQNFTAKYPDRLEIIDDLIAISIEELEHFRQVYKIMEDRGVPLARRMEKDEYINRILALARNGREERYMDRILMAGILEARGAERFILIGENLEDEKLAKFYKQLGKNEEKHIHVFIKMCSYYFKDEEIHARLEELLIAEAEILASLPIAAKLR
jgi:tRNA-(ms[2]io[6]A)-hydroxylase